jgi:hypothetical protein
MEYLPVCGEVDGDVLAVSQSGSGGRYDRGERSGEGGIDTSPVLGRPGESSGPGRSGHEKDYQAAKCQPSVNAIGCPDVDLTFRDIHESADKTVQSYENAPKPIVWIPRDGYGISTDEIRYTAERTESIRISDDGAWLDDRGKVTLEPDQNMSTISR